MAIETELLLFTRDGCHLCEQVERMLHGAGIAWRAVDIDCDPGLAERYGLRIPVLRHPGSGRELDFPFTEDELGRFAGLPE